VVTDPDDDAVTVTVSGLPSTAVFDAATRIIAWTPTEGDVGVHPIVVSATDGVATTERPFVMIAKVDPGAGPIPSGPTEVAATLTDAHTTVTLSWAAPADATAEYYAIYRDGSLWRVVPGTQTSFIDGELIVPGSHTRYDVSLYTASGAESGATSATPEILSVPE
jgi:hypothetical protein